jgi:hypothetical protein
VRNAVTQYPQKIAVAYMCPPPAPYPPRHHMGLRPAAYIDPDEIDKDVAATLTAAYAEEVESTSKELSHARTAKMTPAVLLQTNDILKEFGQLVATHAAEIRNTVTNKLILETENPDARIRIRALELLGKMTDVGLFTDRKEITVTHQTADELREKLREKLTVLKQNAEGVYEAEEEES